jgi:hypothetical protein
MTMTLSEAFEIFNKNNPETTIDFTNLKTLKPPQVKHASKTSHKSCFVRSVAISL